MIYQEIALSIKECNVASRGAESAIYNIVSETSVKLKTLSESMEKLKEKCKVRLKNRSLLTCV